LKRVCCRSQSANNVNFTTINQQQQHQQQQQQRMMASTLVLSEPLDADGITPAGTQSTVTAATKLSSSGGDDTTINLLVVGSIVPTKIPMGISKVFHVPIDDKLSETVANSIIEIIDDDYNVVIGTASKFGSTVIPRTAALLDVSPITDILEIQDESK
jgi:electron transfer flavoprotein alpha subunit